MFLRRFGGMQMNEQSNESRVQPIDVRGGEHYKVHLLSA